MPSLWYCISKQQHIISTKRKYVLLKDERTLSMALYYFNSLLKVLIISHSKLKHLHQNSIQTKFRLCEISYNEKDMLN